MNKPVIPNPEVFSQIVQNQTRELEIRATDQELLKQKDDNAFKYAMEIARLNAENITKESHEERLKQRESFLFLGFIILLIMGVITFALYKNKETIALETLKTFALIITSGFGGFGLGRMSVKKDPPEPPKNPGN